MSLSAPYNFTDLIGAAVESVIVDGQAVVPSVAVLRNRESVTAVLPRIEVDVSNAQQASGQMCALDTETWDFNQAWAACHYRSDVLVTIATDRVDADVDHGALCAQVRYLLSREAQALISPAVTLLEVLAIEHTGTNHDIEADAREDRTQMGFGIEFGVLASAFARSSIAAVGNPSWSIPVSSSGAWSASWTPVSGLTLQVYIRPFGGVWPDDPTITQFSENGSVNGVSALNAGTYNAKMRFHDGTEAGPFSSIFTDASSLGAT